MIGKTISHYKVLDKLGEGGMGVVYKAEDTKLDRTVALKFLTPQALGSDEDKMRFVHEAKAAAALSHNNICTVYEIDEAEGQSFIAMEYVEGQSLKDRIASGPLKLSEGLEIAVQVAGGLEAAHKKGIVHRDIKPANVIITDRDEAKVLDFGLAKLAGQTKLTRTGATVGTVAYMSPEQARGDEVDERTDIWSLGVVLYEMLTGRLPFKGDYEQAVVYSILNEEPEPVDTIRPEIPASIQRVIECTLKKDPRDRYSDISVLMSDLRNLREGSEIRGARRPKRPRAKHIALAASLAAVVVVIASLLPHLWQGVGPTEAEPRTLAIVDFDNIGGEEASHLAFGLAEGICVKLSKVTGIRVVSSDDIRRLRNDNLAARDVAHRLGAEYAVGGSLLKSGSKIRVTPQLIEASTGNIVWSELFDREFTDVFDFLDEASLKIAEALRVELSPSDRVALKEKATDNPEAYDHYLKGRHHYDRVTVGDNELAVKEFKNALKNDPSYPLALAGLADAYVQRYEERFDYDEYWLDQADSLIARTLELDPDLAEAYESRAEVLLEKENLLAALDSAERARSLRPDWDEPYVRLGEIHEKRGEGSRALEMFERALAIRPSVGALCGKGAVFRTRGDPDSAEAAFRAALEHHPNHERPYWELAEVCRHLRGDLEEAERMYRRAIEVRPDHARGYTELSWLLFYGRRSPKEAADLVRGFVEKYPYNYQAYEALFEIIAWGITDWPAAVAVVEEAVARNPDRVWPHLLLASSHTWEMRSTDQPEKAVEAVERAMALRPSSSRVLRQAAETYRRLGKPKKALELCRRALELNPGSAGILGSMANFLLDEARYDSAACVAARAIEQAPGVIENYDLLGVALTHLMRSEEFLRVLENAAEKHGRDNPSFYAILGGEQRMAGQFQEAVSSYRRSLDIKRDRDVVLGLGTAEWLAGDTESALESFTRAAEMRGRYGRNLYERWLIRPLKYLGRFDEIEERLERILAEEQIDTWFWIVAYYYPSMRRFDDALDAATEYLESGEATWTVDIMLKMATWHRRKGNLGESRKVLDEAEGSLPAGYRTDLNFNRAVTAAVVGDLTGAEKLARRALEGSAAHWEQDVYLAFLGRLQYAMGQTEEALATLARRRGRYVRAGLAGLYREAQLGMALGAGNASQNLEKTLFWATRGARSRGFMADLGQARCYAALASARLGNEERARDEIAYALRLEPERADIAYLAACTFSLIGDTETALDWLRTAVDRGHQELWWARVDPDLDNLRELARFQEIMDQWERLHRSMWHEAESSK